VESDDDDFLLQLKKKGGWGTIISRQSTPERDLSGRRHARRR